jgi:hypothetical protein
MMNVTSSEAKYSELVARYKRYREFTRELQSHTLNKYLSKQALQICGKKLEVMRNDTLVLGQMDEICVFMDYCFYDYRQEGFNAVGRYMADSQLDPDSDEYTAVKAMSESFYTLVLVRDVLPGVGVRVNDLLADREYLLIDIGFSQTAVKGLVLATRLLPFDDFVTTSGAALPIDSKEILLEIFNTILPQYGSTDGEYISFDTKQKADLTAAIIRLCLKNDMSSQIQYEDVDDEPVTSPIRKENRIGRNEPCPCGSGRKYKRCCGR